MMRAAAAYPATSLKSASQRKLCRSAEAAGVNLSKVLTRPRSVLPKHQKLVSARVVGGNDAADDPRRRNDSVPTGHLHLRTDRVAGVGIDKASVDPAFGTNGRAVPDRQVIVGRGRCGK